VPSCYIEIRTTAARGTDSIAADVMRHLHARQHLGKAVIVYEQSVGMLGAARKQWLKLSRALQKQRASTLNADKILKYTHSITHMQHMHFSAKSPLENPEADVYFLRPDELSILPVHCWSVYVLDTISWETARKMLGQLPTEALVVAYNQAVPWEEGLGLQPKNHLELRVEDEWRQAMQFLRTYDIAVDKLIISDMQSVETMDNALDTLLGVSARFLQVAQGFQRALELARPLRLSKQQREQYDALVLLAHRVQALASGAFTQHFLESYNEDDTFFLYDVVRDLAPTDLAGAFAYHMQAGRTRLAHALRRVSEGRVIDHQAAAHYPPPIV